MFVNKIKRSASRASKGSKLKALHAAYNMDAPLAAKIAAVFANPQPASRGRELPPSKVQGVWKQGLEANTKFLLVHKGSFKRFKVGTKLFKLEDKLLTHRKSKPEFRVQVKRAVPTLSHEQQGLYESFAGDHYAADVVVADFIERYAK